MAMETVTNYKCDRCGRSEIKEGVTILTLTVRPRIGKHVPGLGKPLVSQHVCREWCLKMIIAAMSPVGRPGRPPRQSVTKAATPAKAATKKSTKNGSAPVSRKITEESASEARARVVKDVRAITRVNGKGFAKGYNAVKERAMIAEAERLSGVE